MGWTFAIQNAPSRPLQRPTSPAAEVVRLLSRFVIVFYRKKNDLRRHWDFAQTVRC